MWPFTKRDQGISVRASSVAEMQVAFRQMYERQHDMSRQVEKALAELREDIDALKSKYESLRGRFYGARLHQVGGRDIEQIPHGDKDALRRHAGIKAGQPFPHRE